MALFSQTVTIAASQTTSAAIDTGRLTNNQETQLVGVSFPAAVGTSTSLTFTASDTLAGTFDSLRVVDGGAAYTVNVTASTRNPVDHRVFVCAPFIRCVYNTTDAADRTLTLHFAEIVK